MSGKPPQVDGVVLCEEGDGPTGPSCTARPSHTVDVADGRGREVVVEDQIHSLEVDPPAHQIGADQDPDLENGNMGICTANEMSNTRHPRSEQALQIQIHKV